jgi:hypothetical protein
MITIFIDEIFIEYYLNQDFQFIKNHYFFEKNKKKIIKY